jgi:peptide chain release factor 1
MFDRLKEVERRYEELERQVADPAVIANRREFAKLAKERSQLEPTVVAWRERQRSRGVGEHRELARGKDATSASWRAPSCPALESASRRSTSS